MTKPGPKRPRLKRQAAEMAAESLALAEQASEITGQFLDLAMAMRREIAMRYESDWREKNEALMPRLQVMPKPQVPIELCLDADLAEHFLPLRGYFLPLRGWQAQVNAILRTYLEREKFHLI